MLGHFLPEIWRSSLHYLVMFTDTLLCTFKHSTVSVNFKVSWFNRRYSVTQFLLPFIVLVYTYTRICMSIWTSSTISGIIDLKKDNKASFAHRNRDPFISKAMINTVKQTIVVVTLYIITNIPFIGCELWATWDPKASTSPFFSGKYSAKQQWQIAREIIIK